MPNVASNDIEEIAIEVLGPGRPRVVDDREALGPESHRTRTGVSLTLHASETYARCAVPVVQVCRSSHFDQFECIM